MYRFPTCNVTKNIPFINKFTCLESQLPIMIKKLESKKMIPILDYTNENPKGNLKLYKSNFKKIKNLIETYPNSTVAVKLSSLGINNDYKFAKNNLFDLITIAKKQNNIIMIDAEYYTIQDSINNISNEAINLFNDDKLIVYKTYQMYRKDYLDILNYDINNFSDRNLGIKLVRGAYLNQDKKYNILCDSIYETHKNYNRGLELFNKSGKKSDRLVCATHNEDSINLAKQLIDNNDNRISFAHLLGMSDKQSYQLSKNYTVYKYLPYGNLLDTLPYLIRRLYENYPTARYLLK